LNGLTHINVDLGVVAGGRVGGGNLRMELNEGEDNEVNNGTSSWKWSQSVRASRLVAHMLAPMA
jgi:hypothetical protein